MEKSIWIWCLVFLAGLTALVAPAKSWGWSAGDVADSKQKEKVLVAIVGENDPMGYAALQVTEVAVATVAQLGVESAGTEEFRSRAKLNRKEAVACVDNAECLTQTLTKLGTTRAIVGVVKQTAVGEKTGIIVMIRFFSPAAGFGEPWSVTVTDVKQLGADFTAALRKALGIKVEPAAPPSSGTIVIGINGDDEFDSTKQMELRALAISLSNKYFFTVVGPEDVLPKTKCETSCVAAMCHTHGANFALTGTVSRVEGQFALSMSLYEADAVDYQGYKTITAESWTDTKDQFMAAVKELFDVVVDVKGLAIAAEQTTPTVTVTPPQLAPAQPQTTQPVTAAECSLGFDQTLAQAREYRKKGWSKFALEKALTARDKCGSVPGKDHLELFTTIGQLFYELNDIGATIEAFEMASMALGSEEEKAEVKKALEALKKEYVKVSVKPTPDDTTIVLECPGTINNKKKTVIQTAIERAQAGKPFEMYMPKPAAEGECKIGSARIIVVEGGAVPIPFKMVQSSAEASSLRFGGAIFAYPTFSGGEYPIGGSLGLGFYNGAVAPFGINMALKMGVDLGYFRTFGSLSGERYNRDAIGQLEVLLRVEASRDKFYALGEIGPGLITEGGVGGGVSTVLALGFKFYKEWSLELQGRGTFGNIGFLWAPLCVRGEM